MVYSTGSDQVFCRTPLHYSCSAPVIFSKTASLQPATLLEMNSHLGFYQGSLELTVVK